MWIGLRILERMSSILSLVLFALQFVDFYLLCRSEYWVANARYYCEHCKIHILDNKAVCYLSQKNFSCMIEVVILLIH